MPRLFFGHLAGPGLALGVVLDQQVEDGRVGDMLGEVGGAGETAARVAARGAQPAEMAGLGAATVVGRDIIGTARRCVLGFGGQQQFAVIQRQPCLPLRVGNIGAGRPAISSP